MFGFRVLGLGFSRNYGRSALYLTQYRLVHIPLSVAREGVRV